METNREPDHDPLANLFAISPQQEVAVEQSVQAVVHRARRQVGVHDVMGLMLVNLWQVLAQMLAPLFLMKKNELNQKKDGDNHG